MTICTESPMVALVMVEPVLLSKLIENVGDTVSDDDASEFSPL